MGPLIAIALLYIALLAMPSTAGLAFFICGALVIAFFALTDALQSNHKSIAAGGVTLFIFLTSFIAPLNGFVRNLVGNGDVASSPYDPRRLPSADARFDPERGVLVRLGVSSDGHYRVKAQLMRMNVNFMVDTGASVTALTYEDAVRVYGREQVQALKFNIPTATANGVSYVAHARLYELRIGKIVVMQTDVVVAKPGALSISLLGMNVLERLTRYEVGNGELVMYQEQ